MSEKLSTSRESFSDKFEQQSNQEHKERLKNKIEKEASEAQKSQSQDAIEAAQKKIEQLAVKSETKSSDQEKSKNEQITQTSKTEERVSFGRTMKRVRKRLSPLEKPLSILIHTPVIDKTSEVVGKTIARPSSMLGGAFFSFIGSSTLLWITRHYGYEYNYLTAILLFGIGMIVGIAIEGLIRTRKRHSK